MYHFGMLIFEMKNQLTEHVTRRGARQDDGQDFFQEYLHI
ncbi:hypothetical protein M2360_004415 [Rhizobium sp. SG_E_25_P2]|jgi:hypothetical protein|nr:hypothetical protein [Rhizobium sp. SG_E_25_P2]